jgi:type IV pilus assembly protein PilB
MGVEPFLIASSVIVIAAQRLVRRICESCKETYKVDGALAKKLGLKPGDKNTAYRGKGCKKCQDTGYKGRVGLIESLVLTQEIRRLIIDKAQEYKIRDAAHKEGMRTLRENGIKKVLSGVTTIEEIMRVTVGGQDIVL